MKLFKSFLQAYFKAGSHYYVDFISQFIAEFIMLYCIYALWTALFAAGSSAYEGASYGQVLTYGVLGAIFASFVTRDGCQIYIRTRIREGTMDTDLLKPVNFQFHLFARDLAQKLSKLIQFTAPILIVFTLITRMQWVIAPQNLLLFLASTFFAYLILFSLNFLFGILCFYTLSLENIQSFYTGIISFLAGQLVPLWFFPQWGQRILYLLPFRYIYDLPMSICVGRINGMEILPQMGLQLFWAVALLLLGQLAWRHVGKAIISQGG